MPSLEFVEELPKEVPSELRVFALEKPRADRGAFVDVLSRLGLMGGFYAFRWDDSGGWATAERDDARVSISKRSGAVRFWTQPKDDRRANPPLSIAESQLEAIARTFLNRTGFAGVPVEQLALRRIAYLRQQAASVTGETRPAVVLDAGVILGRDVDGVPVSGPGGYVMVSVVGDESVASATRLFRRQGAVLRVAEVLQPDYAVEELKRRLSSEGITRPVQVEKSELCYFERGENDEQMFLEPAYAFVYTFETSGNRFPYKSAEVIPAIRESRQNWNPRKRFSPDETSA